MSKKKAERSSNSPKTLNISRVRPETSGFARPKPLSSELCDALRLRDRAIAIFHREESYGLRSGCILMELYPVLFERALIAAGLSASAAIELGPVTDIPCYGLKIFNEANMVFHLVWNTTGQVFLIKFQRGAWEGHIEP